MQTWVCEWVGAVGLQIEQRKGLGREGQAGWKCTGEATREGGSGPATTLLPALSSAVFAYGATGAGKTHTMLGREGDPGIMYLTTMELYRRLEAHQEEKKFEVLISYQEVGSSPPWDWVASSLILTTASRQGWSE